MPVARVAEARWYVRCAALRVARHHSAPHPPTASPGCKVRSCVPIASHSTSSGLVRPGMRSRLRAGYPILCGVRTPNIAFCLTQEKPGKSRAAACSRQVIERDEHSEQESKSVRNRCRISSNGSHQRARTRAVEIFVNGRSRFARVKHRLNRCCQQDDFCNDESTEHGGGWQADT